MKKIKILFINQVTGPLFIDIINKFVEKGYNSVLLTGQINTTYAKLNENVIVKKFIAYKRNNIKQRIFTWTTFFIQTFIYLLINNRKCSRIFMVTNPPIITIIALLFRNNFDILVFDVYPDVLKLQFKNAENNFLYKYYERLNKKIYALSSCLFTISEGMKNEMLKYTFDKNINVINCWANSNFIKPIDKKNNHFINANGLKNKFIVFYSGNLGLTHDIETLLKVANELSNYENIRFVIIGDGVKKKLAEKYILENKLNNILLLPFQENNYLQYTFASADIGVVTLERDAANTSIPSKTYYMLAAGCAIYGISSENSDLSKLIKKYNLGDSGAPKNVDAFKSFVLNCYYDLSLLHEYKSNSRKTASNFTPENAQLFVKQIELNSI